MNIITFAENLELWQKFSANLQVPSDIRELGTLDPIYLENRVKYVNERIEVEQREFLICREGAEFYAQQAELRKKRRNVLTSLRDAIMYVRNQPVKEMRATNAGKRRAHTIESVTPQKRSAFENPRLFTDYVSPLESESSAKRAEEILKGRKENMQLETGKIKDEIIEISSESENEEEKKITREAISRMLGFERHIVMRFEIRPNYREIVHISARTSFSHIGETIAGQLSKFSKITKYEEPLMISDRLNGNVRIEYPCFETCTMRLKFHEVFVDEMAYVVPDKVITLLFAPVHIELGRTFVDRYVRDVNKEQRTLTLASKDAQIRGCFEWKRSTDVFDPRNRRINREEDEDDDSF